MAENTLMVTLDAELKKAELALPNDFNKERFVRNATQLLYTHPELQKFPATQVYMGLLNGAYLGLDFMNKECYLVGYGGKLQFQTSYMGEIKFVKKYSQRKIKDIYAKVVREGDEFTEKITDGHPSLDFKPLPFNGGEIVGVFAVCLFEDGGMIYETMSKNDIESTRRNYSKAANSPAWKNSWEEMAKKTVLRRMCKHIQTDFETTEALSAWEEGSDATFTQKAKREVPVEEEKDTFDITVEATEITEDTDGTDE